MRSAQKVAILFAAIAIGVLSSGCADLGPPKVARANVKPYTYGGGYDPDYPYNSGFIDLDQKYPDYRCPSDKNVKPDYDSEMDGTTGYYTVCTSSVTPQKLLIHGRTQASDIVCVFPAKYINYRNVQLKPSLDRAPAPLSTCAPVNDGGVMVDFTEDSIDFNSVFIVEEQNREQMELCLAAGNYLYCPRYSFGRFR